MALHAWRLADGHLAEQLGVVGDRGEIQRPAQLQRPPAPVLVVGLDLDPLAFGETIRIVRGVARVLGGRVQRKGGMHVQVAKPNAARRVVLRAALSGDWRGQGRSAGSERDATEPTTLRWREKRRQRPGGPAFGDECATGFARAQGAWTAGTRAP